MTETKICQSCSMPMTEDKQFGKNADGSKNKDYCAYCYKDGEFNSPDETMEEMIECCIKYCLEDGTYPDAETARNSMMEFFPKLKRWNK